LKLVPILSGLLLLLLVLVVFVADLLLLPHYYSASAADVRTRILADHTNNQPFSITIKKESGIGG
jgi:hypothetical protein